MHDYKMFEHIILGIYESVGKWAMRVGKKFWSKYQGGSRPDKNPSEKFPNPRYSQIHIIKLLHTIPSVEKTIITYKRKLVEPCREGGRKL